MPAYAPGMKMFLSGVILIAVCAIVPAQEPVRSIASVRPGIEVFLSSVPEDRLVDESRWSTVSNGSESP